VSAAEDVLGHAIARPPRLGSSRLICVDGPAGSGKTTLAAAIAALTPATVVHMDDLYEGWGGLLDGQKWAGALLAPLSEDRPGHYCPFEWSALSRGPERTVAPCALLVLEGVGAWSPDIAPWVTTLAWLDGDPVVRRQRALARDGEVFAPHWDAWAQAEAALFDHEATREHADLVLTTG
jgi:energy-coupling factor transporter ATP-binding protein EcfA2